MIKHKKLPIVLQSEAAECGLACLVMVASFYGYKTDLLTLRQRFATSLKGMTLADMVGIADVLAMAARGLRLEPEEMHALKLPCVLHWDMNHFVVLAKVDRQGVVIHDPARGRREVSWAEVSKHFTGIALELAPTPAFRKAEEKRSIPLRMLLDDTPGLGHAMWQIFLLALVLEILAILSPMLTQWTVDGVLVSGDHELLKVLVVGCLALVLMQLLVSSLRAWAVLHLSTVLGLNWATRVFTHLLRLPLSYFEKRHVGDIASRFHGVSDIQNTLTHYFIEALLDSLLAIGTFTLMTVYSPTLSLIAVTSLLIYAVFRWLWYGYVMEKSEQQLVISAKRESHFLESLRGIQAIKLFGKQADRRASWLNQLIEETNIEVTLARNGIFYRMVNVLLSGLEKAAVLWFGALLVLDNVFSVGMLMAFSAYSAQFSSRMMALIDKIVSLRMLRLQTERLADILLTEPDPQTVQVRPQLNDFSITFHDVWFRHADNEPWLYQGLDFTIHQGESVAITGPSGCGKSTLLKLMLGIYIPQQGEILLGGQPLSQLAPDAIREYSATVMQDDQLFAGSLADNICFFDAAPEMARIEQCAKMAGILDDIRAMPMGLQTLAGDMGTTLSGGQKQRVMLARALYKKPNILLLDEATSHLDTELEKRVNAAIAELKLTRIIVAHRPETIASADRVIRLDRHSNKPVNAMTEETVSS